MEPRLLLETPEEVAIRIACALAHCGRPADLLRLALACRRFHTKTLPEPVGDGAVAAVGGAAAGGGRMLSIAEEAARRWVTGCPAAQRQWVPRREGDGWLSLMQELTLLRAPFVFSHAQEPLALLDGGARVIKRVGDGHSCTARTGPIMRAGQHYAEFKLVGGPRGNLRLGIIRPSSRRLKPLRYSRHSRGSLC